MCTVRQLSRVAVEPVPVLLLCVPDINTGTGAPFHFHEHAWNALMCAPPNQCSPARLLAVCFAAMIELDLNVPCRARRRSYGRKRWFMRPAGTQHTRAAGDGARGESLGLVNFCIELGVVHARTRVFAPAGRL